MGACNAEEFGADGYPIECSNGTKDVDEVDIDCGGSCKKCQAGLACNTGADCLSGVCFELACAATPSRPTIMSFTASKTTASIGFSVKLQAVYAGGVGTIEPGIGAVENGATITTPPLTGNTTFTLTVKKDDLVETQKIDIATVQPPKIESFTSAVPAVHANIEGTTLKAVFSNGKGVIDQGIGEVQSGDTRPTGNLSLSKKYTLTVTNAADDKVTAAVDVEAAVPPVIQTFTAPGAVVSRFKSMNLTAVFTNGKGTIDMGVGAVTSGLAVKTPDVPFAGGTYTLTVKNGLGETATKQLSVTTKKEIFVTDYGADILAFDIDDSGDVTPKRIIATPLDELGILGMAINPVNNEICLANENPKSSITCFDLGGKFRPPYSQCVADLGYRELNPLPECFDPVKRRIMGPNTGFFGSTTVGAYQLAIFNNEIFLADKSSVIKVFNTTDTGDVAPKRTVTNGVANALAVSVNNNELYVANYNNASNSTVTVYPVGATAGTPPTRQWAVDQPTGITVEGNEAFVMNKVGTLTVYDKNTGATLRTLSGPNVKIGESYQCSVSLADNLLVCPDYSGDQTRIFPVNASGNQAPLRSIGGQATYMLATGSALIY